MKEHMKAPSTPSAEVADPMFAGLLNAVWEVMTLGGLLAPFAAFTAPFMIALIWLMARENHRKTGAIFVSPFPQVLVMALMLPLIFTTLERGFAERSAAVERAQAQDHQQEQKEM